MTMEPYDPFAACPKCGYTEISSMYDSACGKETCAQHPEKIRRRCRRCQYCWDQAPLETTS